MFAAYYTPLRPVAKHTRVVDGAGTTLRYIEDPRIVQAGLAAGRYKLIDKRGDWSRCVRDLTAKQPRQSPALASVYKADATWMQKRAVGTRTSYALVRWGSK